MKDYCPICGTKLTIPDSGPCGAPASGYCANCKENIWLHEAVDQPLPEPITNVGWFLGGDQ